MTSARNQQQRDQLQEERANRLVEMARAAINQRLRDADAEPGLADLIARVGQRVTPAAAAPGQFAVDAASGRARIAARR